MPFVYHHNWKPIIFSRKQTESLDYCMLFGHWIYWEKNKVWNIYFIWFLYFNMISLICNKCINKFSQKKIDKMDVSWTYYGKHFTMYVNQTIMLYSSNLCTDVVNYSSLKLGEGKWIKWHLLSQDWHFIWEKQNRLFGKKI